jgi:NAD(P)-dependent dehydrogenase (short-subunit alcohol dehydrogenase family)
VTGGASGIRRETAALFIREGARVVIFDRAVEEDTNVAISYCVDVSDRRSVTDGVEQAAAQLDGFDGLVNCAGIALDSPFHQLSEDAWDLTISVNLTGAFNVIKAALPHLKQAEAAAIVNVISGTALLPFQNLTTYVASKGGLNAFSKALAAELGPRIRVNAAAPGFIETPLSAKVFATPRAAAEVKKRYTLQRFGAPTDVAYGILYLMSNEAAFVTGITLPVDGGRTLH